MEYIKEKQKQNNYFKISGINVNIKNKTKEDVSVRKTIQKLVSIVPSSLLSNIKSINVGQFEELRRRQIQAVYRESSIFVTNEQDSNEDLLDDLVHEVAHSVEEVKSKHIYGDKKIKNEFLIKRKKMWTILKDHGFNIELDYFLEVEYREAFDTFLHKEVGYALLSSMTSKLFYSPYAATSLREYFANGFEAFFLREEVSRLKSISPQLYLKLTELL